MVARKTFIIVLAAACSVVCASSVFALDPSQVTSGSQVIGQSNTGFTTPSQTVMTANSTTRVEADNRTITSADGTTVFQTVQSTYQVIAGAERLISELVTTKTTGNGISKLETLLTKFTYSPTTGALLSASGSGTTKTTTAQGTTSGTITNSYVVKDNQALLARSTTSTSTYDKNNVKIGSSSEVKNYSYVSYSGKWLVARETTTLAELSSNGETKNTTTTRVYNRDSGGNVIGVSQTATGTMKDSEGKVWNLTSYTAGFTKNTKGEFELSGLKSVWTTNTNVLGSLAVSGVRVMGLVAGQEKLLSEAITIKSSDGKGGQISTTNKTQYNYDSITGRLLSSVATIDKTSSDGSISKTSITTRYTYSSTGLLIGASGAGTFSEKDGETGTGKTGTVKQTYMIRDNQAIPVSSVKTGDIRDKNGLVIGTFTDTKAYSSALFAGKWLTVRETDRSVSTFKDGSSASIMKTLSIARDSTGKVIGMSQTAAGTRSTVLGTNGAWKTIQDFKLTSYQATFSKDSNGNFYLSKEAETWTITSTRMIGGPSTDVNGSGSFNFSDVEYLFNNMETVGINKGDFNANGRVDFADIVILFNKLPATGIALDLDKNGGVNANDVTLMFNSMSTLSLAQADLNGNGRIDFADVGLAASLFGSSTTKGRLDYDGNGMVNMNDIKFMFNNMNTLTLAQADLNNNGRIDFADITLAYNYLY